MRWHYGCGDAPAIRSQWLRQSRWRESSVPRKALDVRESNFLSWHGGSPKSSRERPEGLPAKLTDSPRALTHNKLSGNRKAGSNAFYVFPGVLQGANASLGHAPSRDTNGRKGWLQHIGQEHVVQTNQRQIVGHTETHAMQTTNRTKRGEVVSGQKCGGPRGLLHQRNHRLFAACYAIVTRSNEIRVEPKSTLLQSYLKRREPNA